MCVVCRCVHMYVGMHMPMLPVWRLEVLPSHSPLILSRQGLSLNPDLDTLRIDWMATKPQ